MKKLKILFILLCILIIACSCDILPVGKEKNNSYSLKSIREGDFLVGFSNTLDRGVELGVYKEEGPRLNNLEINDSIALTMSAYNEPHTYFSSNRSNNHFIINNKNGEVNKINQTSLSDKSEDEGAFFINTSAGYVIHDINVGYTDTGLQGELVYWKDGEQNKKQLTIKGEIGSAIVAENNIYAITSDEDSMSIVSINPETNKQINKVAIPNKSVYFMPEKNAFQVLDEKTLMLAVNDNVNGKENSKILLIDRETLKTKKEIEMEKGFHPERLKILKDEIIAVSYNGKVNIYDKNINKKSSFDFYAGNNDFLLNDVQFDTNKMYVLIKGFDMQKDNVLGEITSYELKSGKKVKTTQLKAKKEWEIARFELLNNDS